MRGQNTKQLLHGPDDLSLDWNCMRQRKTGELSTIHAGHNGVRRQQFMCDLDEQR